MDFEYSPTFSCRVANATQSSSILVVTTTNMGTNNQLYLMYIATDHPSLGVYMPNPFGNTFLIIVTDQLNMRLQSNSQSQRFNYR